MTKPASKQEVYNPYTDPQWADQQMVSYYEIKEAAKRQGFSFTRALTLPVDPNFYSIDHAEFVGVYDNLPDAPAPTVPTAVGGKTIVETALEYLASPDRSERLEVLQRLNSAGFFAEPATTEYRVTVIRELIDEYAEDCASGAQRAREWFAGWLGNEVSIDAMDRLNDLISDWVDDNCLVLSDDDVDKVVHAVVKIVKESA